MRKKILLSLIITFVLGACAGKNGTATDTEAVEKESDTADVDATVDSIEESSQIVSEVEDEMYLMEI